MHLFTDSIAALREAVCRPSERLSGLELVGEEEYLQMTNKMQMEAQKMIELERGQQRRPAQEVSRTRGMEI